MKEKDEEEENDVTVVREEPTPKPLENDPNTEWSFSSEYEPL